jgi:hypothetical protein
MLHLQILAAVSESTDARHLREIGLGVGGLGAAALLIGAVLGYLAIRSGSRDVADTLPDRSEGRRTAERVAYAVAGLLLGVGFLIQIIAARTA